MNLNEEIVMKVTAMTMTDEQQKERFKDAKDAKMLITSCGVHYMKITY